MSWKDNEIAGPMGYEYCVLFDCARDAISAYHSIADKPIALPENICPELASHMEKQDRVIWISIDQQTGLAKSAVHLYGYQASYVEAVLAIDPLMTGWVRHLKTPSAIISFGAKKMLSLGYGGAFLTNDPALAYEMDAENGHWNTSYTQPLIEALNCFAGRIDRRREATWLWDRYLGDSLIRIPQEQLMPWRVMRRAHSRDERTAIVIALRTAGFDVGTNYPPLKGRNEWGDTVLNFFPYNIDKTEIQRACELIKRTTDSYQFRKYEEEWLKS